MATATSRASTENGGLTATRPTGSDEKKGTNCTSARAAKAPQWPQKQLHEYNAVTKSKRALLVDVNSLLNDPVHKGTSVEMTSYVALPSFPLLRSHPPNLSSWSTRSICDRLISDLPFSSYLRKSVSVVSAATE